VLKSCFVELKDGYLINEKLHSLRTEKDVERLKKAENGRKGGISKATAKHLVSTCHIEEKRREEKIKEENIKDTTPNGVDESVFKDYLKIRKAQKKPFTSTALKLMESECKKAGISLQQAMEMCCARGWVGFKADWVKDAIKPAENDKSWMFSNQGIEAKARELGVNDYGIANHQQLKDKILLVMAKKQLQ
jgi:hypothetical protein